MSSEKSFGLHNHISALYIRVQGFLQAISAGGGGGAGPPPQTLFTPPQKRARIGMNRALGHLCAHAKLGQENLLRMVR